MLKMHPKPDTEAAAPPKLDVFISDSAGKLARIQDAVLYIAWGVISFPILWLKDSYMLRD